MKFIPLSAALVVLPLFASSQTLTITNGVQTFSSLTNATVTMTGRSELRITSTGNPIPGCVINLNSPDAWLFFPNIRPSVVAASYLAQVFVNGAAAIAGSNVRVDEYVMGTAIVPQGPGFTPLQIFTGPNFLGGSRLLGLYTYYTNATLGGFYQNIGSFRLKRGYSATFAQNANGTGVSKVYVAQDGDLDIGMMPTNLDRVVSFVRVFPWRWTGKKGWAGGVEPLVDALWNYDWDNVATSALDTEYVPMRHDANWNAYSNINGKQKSTEVLGFNEPDKSDQANMTVADAIAQWPNLLQSGLRLGAPAVSDTSGTGFGKSWLYSFMSQADALGYRVDFIPIHVYCPASSASALMSYLQDVYNQTKRPVWVTEFNYQADWCGGSTPTYDQEATVIGQMIDALEAAPYVERYSIYSWLGGTRAMITNGVLTPAGIVYHDKASTMAYAQAIPAAAGNRSVAQLRFEDNALDTSGFGNNGTAAGIPEYIDGQLGRAVVLDGTNNFIQLPGTIGNSASFSFAAWVFWNGGGNWQRIFDLGSDTTHYLFLTPRSGSGTLRFAINIGSGEQIVQTTSLPTGQWCHVAFTLAGNVGRLYTNGVLVASASITSAPSAANPLRNYLGKSQFAADPLFSGDLDDVQIADYAFSQAQIAALMSDQPPQFLTNTIAGGAAVQGQFYSNNIAGAATDPDPGDTLTYSKASGPAWLTMSANGTLTGTPTPADGGTNFYTVRVTDAAGASAYALFTIDMALVNVSGVWTANADGDWSDTNNWAGRLVANGPGFTADFSTLNIAADRTVNLDTPRSIGVLRFADALGLQKWTVTSHNGSILTLDTGSSATPSLVVTQSTATLAVTLAGANGFVKSGPGTLILAAGNTLSGALNLDQGVDGNINDGITRLAHPNAAVGVSSINIRNTSVSTAGGATLQLDGSQGNIVINKPCSFTCRNNTTTPTIENLSGTNRLGGFMGLGTGGNSFNIQCDSGLLILSGTNQYVGGLTGARTYAFSGAGDHLVSGPILNSTNTAPISLTKSGNGTLTLAGTNTYANFTTVVGGTLLVNGSISTGAVTIASSATLGGNGVIRGPVTIQSNAKLSPGAPIGRLTVSNSVTLNAGSTTLLAVDRSIPANDLLIVSGLFTRGGALVVTNAGPELQAADSFDLFNTPSQAGAFSSMMLPALVTGLHWNTNLLAASGLISVEATIPPALSTSVTGGTNLVLQFSSQAGVSYFVQSATNLAAPVTWSDGQAIPGTGGTVTFQTVIGDDPQRFFRITAH